MDQYSCTLWEYFSSSHGAIIHDHRHKTSNHWPTEHVLIGSMNALKQPTAPVPYIITAFVFPSCCGYLFVVHAARVRVLFPTPKLSSFSTSRDIAQCHMVQDTAFPLDLISHSVKGGATATTKFQLPLLVCTHSFLKKKNKINKGE